MRLQDHIDFTTLQWVKPELAQTLAAARQSLEAYVDNPGKSESIHSCVDDLHQVHGTLRMVELYGAAMVAEEMETLAIALMEDHIQQRDEAYAALMRGLVQLPDYLERLSGGHRDVPVVLLPLLNELRASRDQQALHESVLFRPNLDAALPASVPGAVDAATAEVHRGELSELRVRFQQQLLAWFRGQSPAQQLAGMQHTLLAIADHCHTLPARRLWWIASAMLEGVEQGALRSQGGEVRQLIGRVDRSLRQLIEDGEEGLHASDADELARKLLYVAMQARQSTPQLDQLRQTYQLDALSPDAGELEHARGAMSGHNRALLDSVARALKEDLLRVKEALDLFLRNPHADPARLGEQAEVLERVGDTFGMLSLTVPRRVVGEQRRILSDIANRLRSADEEILLDVAGALLYVETSLDDHIDSLGTEAAAQDDGGTTGLLPRSEARNIIATLMHEATANTTRVKESIVAFVESGWQHGELKTSVALMDEVAGALRMLSAPRPALLTAAIARFIGNELVVDRRVPSVAQMDQLADALAALEYYLEAAREHRGGLEHILDIAEQSLGALGYFPPPAARVAPPSEAEPVGEHPALSEPVALFPGQDLAALLVGADEPVPALVHDLDGMRLTETGAPDAPVAEPAAEEDWIEIEEEVTEQVPAHDALTAQAGFRQDASGIDDDIREIFLEEVAEEIDNLDKQLGVWLADVGQHAALVPVRRSFHTLKGSGRLVGANLLGEFAWKVENMLNRVLDNTIQPDAHVQALVRQAIETLPELLDALKGEGRPHAPIAAIMQVADELAAGQPARVEDVVIPMETVRRVVRRRVPRDQATVDAVPTADLADMARMPEPETPVQAIEPGGDIAPVDPVLLEILRSEVAQYLTTIRGAVAHASGELAIDEALMRAVHTMHGALAMVDIPPVVQMLSPLESLLKRLRALGRPLPADGIQALRRAADVVDDVLARLDTDMPRLPAFQDLTDRLVEMRNALPEEPAGGMHLHTDEVRPPVDAEPAHSFAEALEDHPGTPVHPEQEAPAAAPDVGAGDEATAALEAGEASDHPDHVAAESLVPAIEQAATQLPDVARPVAPADADALVRDDESDALFAELAEAPIMPPAEEDVGRAASDVASVEATGEPASAVAHEAAGPSVHASVGAPDETSADAAAPGATAPGVEAVHAPTDTLGQPEETPHASSEPEPVAVMPAQTPSQAAEQASVPPASHEAGDVPPYSHVDADLLEIFTDEAREILDHIEGVLAQWRAEPAESAHVASVLRDLHTLKGGARIAGLVPIGDLTHAMETMLEKSLDATVPQGGELIATVEAGFDRLHQLVQQVVQGYAIAYPQAMIDRCLAMSGASDADVAPDAGTATPIAAEPQATAEVAALPVDTEPVPAEPTPEPVYADVDLPPLLPEEPEEAQAPQEQIRVRAELLDTLVNHAGEVAIYRSRLEQQVAGYRFNLAELDQTVQRLRSQLRMLEIETEAQIIARFQREQREAGVGAFDPLELDRYSQLQQYSRALAESVSDLVAIQSMLDELTRQAETLLVQQSRVSSELQDGLLRTRMVPFDTMVPNLRRTLRQAAQEQHKEAQLYVDGAHGEMDRHLLDRIKAPFEHMLRNAIAHGIESPAERRKAGKPTEGAVRINVAREATEVVVRVSDDGRGLDRDAIRARAVERKLLRPDSRPSDDQLLGLITQTGFSTASEVTQLAGRGVGMDVVANEIKQLGGVLAVDSQLGNGTTFTMRLPFTLAVTQAILVRLGEANFAIPMTSVQGVVRITPDELAARLAEDEPVFHYSGESYGVYDLSELLGLPPTHVADEAPLPLLLTRSGDLRAAIRIDAVIGSHEIVVKSVGPQISSVPGILGATIMGDGSVLVILDLGPLVRHGITRREQRLAEGLEGRHVAVAEEARAKPLIMVVDDSITMRKVTGRVLERHEYEVSAAKDGVDALEKLAERVPDLMLLDIEMPRMDGYELATHMKSDPRLREVPIIMITSRSGDKHRQRALDIGVDRYLGKPYQEADLLAQIAQVLDARAELLERRALEAVGHG